MSESLFLINPRRRKRRKGRMPAGLARYWASRRGGRKRRKARAVMTNPRRRRRRARASTRRRAVRRNPVYRHKRHHRRRARNPIYSRRRSRRRGRNPFSVGGAKEVLVPAAIGAGGAIALAVAWGYLAPKLPASLQTGYLEIGVKLAGAIGLGLLANRFLGRQKGMYVGIGGSVVVLAQAITPMLASAAPTVPGLSGFGRMSGGDYAPYPLNGMGAYMKNPSLGRLGFYSPAAIVQGPAGPQRMGAGLSAYQTPMGAYMKNTGMSDLTGSNYTWQNDGM